MAAKKIAPRPRKPVTALDDIVQMKKQKVMSNELDEFVAEQERRKVLREKGITNPAVVAPVANPALQAIAANPEVMKGLSSEDVMKMAMLMGSGSGGSGGGINPMIMMMLMNQNQGGQPNQPSQLLDMVTALKGLSDVNKANQPQQNVGQNDQLMQIVMAMMMQNMNKPAEPVKNSNDTLVAQLLTLVAGQGATKERVLLDKIKELEFRTSNVDPLSDAMRVMEYMKTMKPMFGGQSTPQELTYNLDMEKLKFDQQKEMRRMETDDAKITQVGGLISKSLETFADALSKPIADKLKAGLAPTQKIEQEYEEPYIPPTQVSLRDDPDIDELSRELELNDDEFDDNYAEEPKSKSRFYINSTE